MDCLLFGDESEGMEGEGGRCLGKNKKISFIMLLSAILQLTINRLLLIPHNDLCYVHRVSLILPRSRPQTMANAEGQLRSIN